MTTYGNSSVPPDGPLGPPPPPPAFLYVPKEVPFVDLCQFFLTYGLRLKWVGSDTLETTPLPDKELVERFRLRKLRRGSRSLKEWLDLQAKAEGRGLDLNLVTPTGVVIVPHEGYEQREGSMYGQEEKDHD